MENEELLETELTAYLKDNCPGFTSVSRAPKFREIYSSCVIGESLNLDKLERLMGEEKDKRYSAIKEFGKTKVIYICESPALIDWQVYQGITPVVRTKPKRFSSSGVVAVQNKGWGV
jgi:hypothetical protein